MWLGCAPSFQPHEKSAESFVLLACFAIKFGSRLGWCLLRLPPCFVPPVPLLCGPFLWCAPAPAFVCSACAPFPMNEIDSGVARMVSSPLIYFALFIIRALQVVFLCFRQCLSLIVAITLAKKKSSHHQRTDNRHCVSPLSHTRTHLVYRCIGHIRWYIRV